MDRIASEPVRQRMYILSALSPATSLYMGLLTVGADPDRPPASPHGDWHDHLLWGVDSAVAATRLLLCGQVVGAATMVRHQLERWLMHRAHNGGITQEPGESTADFIARAWGTEDNFHEDWFAESPVPPLFDERDSQTPSPKLDHAHVTTTDGRVLCPGWIYCGLSEMLHGRLFDDALTWDSDQLLTGQMWTPEMSEAVELITGGITLSLRQIRVALAGVAMSAGDVRLAANLKAGLDSFSTSALDPNRHARALESVLRSMGVETEDAATSAQDGDRYNPPDAVTVADAYASEGVSPPILALAPLVPHEGLGKRAQAIAVEAAAAFEAVCRGERPAGRLFTDDELTTLAFVWHRDRAIQVALTAMETERRIFGDEFDLDGLTARERNWVLITETTSLLTRWATPPALASAAAVVASGLRSAYWLWLEDDSRAMAALRAVLEQTARMRVWRLKPGRAAVLEERDSTTPRDWLEKAGWKRLAALNRALGEFAHTKAGSRWTGAHELLAELQPGVDEERAIYTARGAALDFVSSLVAAEVIEIVRGLSSSLAESIEDLFAEVGIVQADPSDPDVQATFNHMWERRTSDLGNSDFTTVEQSATLKYVRRKRVALHNRHETARPDLVRQRSTNPFIRPNRPSGL